MVVLGTDAQTEPHSGRSRRGRCRSGFDNRSGDLGGSSQTGEVGGKLGATETRQRRLQDPPQQHPTTRPNQPRLT